jgi:hypothetical protein
MKFAAIYPGAIVVLSYDPLGISSAKFRVDSVDLPGVESLEIKCKATQVVETMLDSNYTDLGGSLYERNLMEPSAYPKYRSEILLPYTPIYGTEWHTLFLLDRQKGYENGFYVETREGPPPAYPYTAGSDVEGYHTSGFLTTSAKRIEVTPPVPYLESGADPTSYKHYPLLYDHTYQINDETEGITIFIDGDTLNLTEFPPVNRVGLFTTNRFLYIFHRLNDFGYEEPSYQAEFIAFQNIEAISNPSTGSWSDSNRFHFYKITSFMKASLYTQPKTHYAWGIYGNYPKGGWIFKLGNNILKNSYLGLYRTILPSTLYDIASMSTSHPYFPAGKYGVGNYKFFPEYIHNPGRIYALRSGSTINVRYYPATYTLPGAGHGNPDQVTDSYPFVYEGYLCFKYGSTTIEKESPDTEIIITDSNSVTLTVEMSNRKGNFSYISGTLVIGTSDGEYIGYTTKYEV